MFKTKKEKFAFVQGIKAGNKGKKPWGKQNKKNERKKKGYPIPGAYNSRGWINDNLVDDLHGPVVFWEGFEFDN